MRPGSDPLQGLKNGVNDAAERLGFNGDLRATLRKRVDQASSEETAYALRCGLAEEASSVQSIRGSSASALPFSMWGIMSAYV
jgi:hypothetical protein